MKIYQCTKLSEVEELLEELFKEIILVSEIPLAKADFLNIENLFKSLFRKNKNHHESFIREIWKRYPFTCLTLTVFIAVYYYDGGFWPFFREKTGCDNDNIWRECLFHEMKKQQLPLFDEFRQQKYVSTILGHAGIPEESFPGFVEGFLEPVYHLGISGSEALDYLDDEDIHSELKLYKLHKGVRDYLTHGGSVAEDFIDRCLQLLPEDLSDVSRYTKILPRRIVRKLHQWKMGHLQSSSNSSKELPILPPVMKIDPYIKGIYLEIPIQTWAISESARIKWIIKNSLIVSEEINCDLVLLRTSGEIQVIPHKKEVMINPNQEYEVTLQLNDEPKRKWRFITKDVLYFDHQTQKQLRRASVNSSGQWIILGNEYHEVANSKANYTLTREPLFDRWQNYSVWEIHSEMNMALTFSNGKQKVEVPVFSSKELPFLKSDEQISVWGLKYTSFYHLPTLCLPLSNYPDLRGQSHLWTLSLIYIKTGAKQEIPLNDCVKHVKLIGENYEIALSDLFQLGDMGEYHVRFIGKLGSDIRLSFHLLPPSLRVEELRIPQFPRSSIGYKEEEFTISLDTSIALSCLGPNEVRFNPLAIHGEKAVYKLVVPAQVSTVDFQLYDRRTSDSITIDFVPRAFSWKIIHGTKINRTNVIETIDEKKLIDSPNIRAVVDTQNLSRLTSQKYLEITLVLKDDTGKRYLPSTKNIRVGTQTTVDLIPYIETIREIDTRNCSIWMDFQYLLSSPVKLLSIQKQWDVFYQNIQLDSEQLHLSWQENYPVRNRIIRIWDQWHPWNPVETYSVSDEECYLVIDWKNRALGQYLIEWTVEPEQDPFDFLDDQIVHYPANFKNTFLWDYAFDDSTNWHHTLSTVLFSHDSKRKKAEFTRDDLEQTIRGLFQYGKHFFQNQQSHLQHWRTVCRENQEQISKGMESLHLDQEVCSYFNFLAGIHEWDVNLIHRMGLSKEDNWFHLLEDELPLYNFGIIKGQIFLLLSKSVEDLNQIAQMIPPFEGFLREYNIPVMIIHFVSKCKLDASFRYGIQEFVGRYSMDIETISDFVHHQIDVPKIITELITMRKDHGVDAKYALYPYFVSLVALSQRLMSRVELPFSITRKIREIEIEIHGFTPEWLQHDRYFLESFLLRHWNRRNTHESTSN